MKQHLGELIKKSTNRYSILLVSGFVIASLIPRPRKVRPMAKNFGPSIALKNQKLKAKVIIRGGVLEDVLGLDDVLVDIF